MVRGDIRKKIASDYRQHEHDTGSVEVQIALLTERIDYLNKHFEKNRHDYASHVGLLRLVGQRRRFLRYLKRKNPVHYQQILNRLQIRG